MNEAALESVLTDAQGYPYFIQLWGEALWDADTANQCLDTERVATARPAVDAERDDLYKEKFAELATRKGPTLDADRTLQAAAAVAGALLDDGYSPLPKYVSAKRWRYSRSTRTSTRRWKPCLRTQVF